MLNYEPRTLSFERTNRYTLAPQDGPREHWSLNSPLLLDGRPAARRLPGYLVEAAYTCRLGTVLITSYDCPFEEGLEFLLLDDDQNIIAHKALGTPYHSYFLVSTHARQGHIELLLPGDEAWRLSLHPRLLRASRHTFRVHTHEGRRVPLNLSPLFPI